MRRATSDGGTGVADHGGGRRLRPAAAARWGCLLDYGSRVQGGRPNTAKLRYDSSPRPRLHTAHISRVAAHLFYSLLWRRRRRRRRRLLAFFLARAQAVRARCSNKPRGAPAHPCRHVAPHTSPRVCARCTRAARSRPMTNCPDPTTGDSPCGDTTLHMNAWQRRPRASRTPLVPPCWRGATQESQPSWHVRVRAGADG